MKKFRISSISDEKIDLEKIAISNSLEDILNNNLEINNYSNFACFFLIYIATEPKKSIQRTDKLSFLRKDNVLQLNLNLDYYEFQNSTKDEALAQMALLYLKGIELFLKRRKDFDAKRFYADVEKLFEPILNKELQIS